MSVQQTQAGPPGQQAPSPQLPPGPLAGVYPAALLMSLLTFQDAPPADRSAPKDPAAIGLAAAGSVAAFWGASELLTHRFGDPVAFVPLGSGLALITALWVFTSTGPSAPC